MMLSYEGSPFCANDLGSLQGPSALPGGFVSSAFDRAVASWPGHRAE
jgi:hypothetical protein